MPELPEVETVKRILDPLIMGRTIISVEVDPDFPGVLCGPDGVDASRTLPGLSLQRVSRRGKYLIVGLSDLWHLIVHLRMTGRLLVVDHDTPAVRFEHLRMALDDGNDIRFADQRKFGRVELATIEDVKALDRRLGVEPLTHGLSPYRLQELFRGRKAPVKSAMLNQHLIAGLGNIYVDEALFRAGIHPLTPAGDLNLIQITALVEAIQYVLKLAIRNQGTTFANFENPYGEAGGNKSYLRVYGKGRRGEPCPRCGAELERLVIGGRGTVYCPLCQPQEV
ncbi:MAG: bifunctional DNA-formamidopyrimidine glycosylase/DNA-(apurinic or apyrimidinic site) lyase [Thermomicrobiales bacterium]|nr:bifunctional DNA-formamidopyrimidine glycosylase/DNA-(apurinic or apyrimidinic site) lyase [Thermomicrobiales bacterium]MCO5224526.1 bifunctional DNA-formamidopyrimidine glycosylase/DNA-(apurinic or apyrimidinic site) lyase [Thermomicrobiales bacterium]MCO5228694.1 bifunctional DNA-formamidopyrimidine glycosylase/DNA-(apurinic or apyrimidinic site) lyase [Thermomicrobiales bacterium]